MSQVIPLHAGAAYRPLRLLIADDQPQMRWMLRRALAGSAEFEVIAEAANGEEAIALAHRLKPDVALVDLAMPVLDGIGTIRALRASGIEVRALVLTGNGDRDSVAQALEAGADGYVLKGCAAEELRAAIREVGRGGAVLAPQIARGVVEDYARMLEEKRSRDLAVIRTLASAVERRDQVTGDHANNVARLSLALWEHMIGEEPEEDLVYGFLLHDVGKIAIPDSVLLKRGPLHPEEITTMRRHVEIGVELVSPLGFRPVVTDVIRCHHERWDGYGYPNGLRGEEIPFHARIFTVVDAFDSMTSDRPYRKGMSVERAIEELERAAGSQFDCACVEAFTALIGEMYRA